MTLSNFIVLLAALGLAGAAVLILQPGDRPQSYEPEAVAAIECMNAAAEWEWPIRARGIVTSESAYLDELSTMVAELRGTDSHLVARTYRAFSTLAGTEELPSEERTAARCVTEHIVRPLTVAPSVVHESPGN